MSAATEWVQAMYRRHGQQLEVPVDIARCIDTLCSIAPPYRLGLLGGETTPDTFAVDHRMVSMLFVGDLASFDADGLTRLVVAAHRNCVRVGIHPWSPSFDDERAGRIREWMVERYVSEFGADPADIDDEVSLSAIEITAHPRSPAAAGLFERHRSTSDLIELIGS